jgi:hypothetical protein
MRAIHGYAGLSFFALGKAIGSITQGVIPHLVMLRTAQMWDTSSLARDDLSVMFFHRRYLRTESARLG